MKNKNIFSPLGASNHSKGERQSEDYYATDPKAVRLLLRLESFQPKILEPMCGEGHISRALIKKGYEVKSFDIVDRGYGKVQDFLKYRTKKDDFDIITNPPYKDVDEYVYHGLSLLKNKKQKMALFLRLLYLEGKYRKHFFTKYPPIRIWVSSSRITCAKNGDFEKYSSSAMAYAWFIWKYRYIGPTTLSWFN